MYNEIVFTNFYKPCTHSEVENNMKGVAATEKFTGGQISVQHEERKSTTSTSMGRHKNVLCLII